MPGIHGAPLIVALAFLAIGYLFKRYRWFPRGIAWCFAIAAFFAMFALTPLLDAIVQEVASPKGMVAVVLALFITGAIFVAEALLARKHHPVGTPFTAVLFGAVGAVVYADWKYLGANAKSLLPATRSAMNATVADVQSGHAANALTAAQKDKWLMIGAIILVVTFFWLRWSHKRHGAPRRPTPVGQGGGGMLGGLVGRAKTAIGGGSQGGGRGRGRQGGYPAGAMPGGPRGIGGGE